MIQKVALSFYGPTKIEGHRETLDMTFKNVLTTFMQNKGIEDYKIHGIVYEGRDATRIIGSYFYKGVAVVEFKERGKLYASEESG